MGVKINRTNILSKIVIALLLIACMSMPIGANAQEVDAETVEKVALRTAENIINSHTYMDEWAIIGLNRYKGLEAETISKKYSTALGKELIENSGILTTNNYTEYSKAILALTSMGINPVKIQGYDLTAQLEDLDMLTIQGINGPIWALLALDSGGYGSESIREVLVEYILENEISGGGWSLSSDTPDIDITSMALTALSPYSSHQDVAPYIQRGLDFLSSSQKQDGGFESMDTENSESSSQVIVALTSLGIDPMGDSRFIRNGNSVIDSLLDGHYNGSGGFSHLRGQKEDKIATEQAFYALVSYIRLRNGETSLFNMTDIQLSQGSGSDTGDKQQTNPFVDIDLDKEKDAILSLYESGVIKGVTPREFMPNKAITRAEFATLITRALKAKETHGHGFLDVQESDWFSGYVGSAKSLGLLNGYPGNVFKPQNNITRQEAAMIIYNTARAKGLDITVTPGEFVNNLSQFPDYREIPSWSQDAMVYGVREGIIPDDTIYIEAGVNATRSQVAGMLHRLFEKVQNGSQW